MPTFEFTSPDGKTIEVTGPEGSTPAQAFNIAKSHGIINAAAPTSMVASPPVDSIWNRFSQTVTTNSPLNPMNWPGMVKSAFESPFSDQNMQEAQHRANVFNSGAPGEPMYGAGKNLKVPAFPNAPPEPFTRGDIGEGLGHLANGVAMYGLGNEIGAEPPLPFPGFDQIGAVARGAAKGAYTGATDTVPVNFKRFGVGAKFSIPAPMAAAGLGVEAGGALGAPFGLAKPGAAIGGVVGGASPIIRGAIQGGKQALRKFAEGAGEAEASGIPAPPPVASPTPSPAPASAPVTPPPAPLASSAEQSLPGGRAVVGEGQIPVRQHETNVKVDEQIKNKVNNLAEYLRSKGGTPEHLDMIVKDPELTKQYLREAHAYGTNRGNPVPKTGYKGLDPGSDSHMAVRQRILDMIEEEKNKP